MLKIRKLWLLLALMTGALLFNGGYSVRAKKTGPLRQGPAKPSEVTSVPEPGLVLKAGEPQSYPGARGTSQASSVVNFAELAQSPQPARRSKRDKNPVAFTPDIEGSMPGWKHPNAPDSYKTAQAPVDSRKYIQAGVPSPAPGASFSGFTDGENGGDRFTRPDATGAVGPNHVVTVTNDSMRIHQRNGATVSTIKFEAFWASLNVFDMNSPRCLYDPFGQRWILTAVDNAPVTTTTVNASILLAVTAGSDPTGQWQRYRIDANGSANLDFADYTSLGFTKDWITVSVNMLEFTSNTFIESRIYAFEKPNLYAGGATALHTVFSIVNNPNPNLRIGSSFVPAVTYDNSLATQYLINRFNSAGGTLGIFTITGPVSAPTFADTTLRPTSPVPWSNFPAGVFNETSDFAPQAGSNFLIQNFDSRMQSVTYRNGSLWCAHNVFFPAGGRPSRASAQWWQISPGNAAVQQRGVIDDPNGNAFYAFPSIAVNVNNDVLVGYSRFSGTQFASANYAFRAAGDPASTLREDNIMKGGDGFFESLAASGTNPWGFYSAAAVDPNNSLDLWTLQQYASAPVTNQTLTGRWGTWWASVRADGTAPGPAATPQVVTTPTPTPPAPANDNFANARVLNGCVGFVTSENVSATKENGEPEHAENEGGKSAWFRWQAPANGQATITTAGSGFDTLLGVYQGNSVDGLTLVGANDDGGQGLTSRVTFTATSGAVYQIAVDGYQNTSNSQVANGDILLNWELQGGCAPATFIQFSRPIYNTPESTGVAVLTLRRQGSLFSASTVEFQTADGTAEQRTDYTISVGTVTFASGEAFKTIAIPVTDDARLESNESLTVTLSNPTNASLGTNPAATVNIINNEGADSPTNPADTARFFVRQQYADFLSREPDQGGFDFWTGELTSQTGGGLTPRRWQVSNAFFFELEYQQTGAYTYRLYRAAFGNTQPFPNPNGDMDAHPYCQANPANCQLIRAAHVPSYARFASDRARVIGGPQLADTQLALAVAFAQRAEFTARYPLSQTAEQYVDALLATIQAASGANLTGQRAALIALYNGAGSVAAGRGTVLFRLAEDSQANPIDNRAFIDAEYNRAFVTTQYYGYLRRDADLPGLNFWLSVINQSPPRDVGRQLGMVCAFITSGEYQQRFSPLTPRGNGECP